MKKLFLTLFVAFITLIFFIQPATSEASPILERSIKNHLGEKNSSVSLRSTKTGKLIYDHNGSVARQTASNMKLLTGAAVLQQLGEDYRFPTTLYIDGKVTNGTLAGNVYLQGSGDPTLQYNHLQKIAKQLAAQGIKKVAGQLYLDDTLFTDSQVPPGATRSEETYYYAARSSALQMSPNNDFDTGTVNVTVTGTSSGKAPKVSIYPHASGQKVVNRAKTGSRTSISIYRQYNTNQIIVSGTIAAGRSTKKLVTVHDPTLATGHTFQAALKAAGVTFTTSNPVKKKAVSKAALSIYVHESQKLSAMFPVYMKLSNNGMADTFVRAIAAKNRGKGTLSTGASDMKRALASIGMPTAKMTILDGSGLSSKNKVQSNQISSLLYNMQSEPTFDTFYKSLPVGGQSNRLVGGTLKNRFTGIYKDRVAAKTGYISGVYALSGYVKTKAGNEFIFSILTEHRNSSAINGIDRVVKTIIDYY